MGKADAAHRWRNRNANGSARRKLRARVAAMGLPCHICGQPIDYSLPAGDPMSYELDELLPVSLGGSPIDPANVAPAHRACNQMKGNKIGFTLARPAATREDRAPSSRF